MTVLRSGVQTTVQDGPGRTGYWDVGVPPSGAFDEFSMALAQEAVGNPPTAAGLECVVHGPAVSFDRRVLVCLTGAAHSAAIDGRPVRAGRVSVVDAGEVLDVGPVDGPGMRAYVAIAGGLDVPFVLGSRATFILAGFGGFDGRPIRAGDVIDVGDQENLLAPLDVVDLLPQLTDSWTLRVITGPHGAPEYLTAAGVDELVRADWLVDHRADRTGVRLVGPAPQWSREDGGEAGIHPSNLHDSAYPVGGIMLSGDTPVIVGKDGPSLGGFVVPAVVIAADLWKLGQLRPGDRVRLSPVEPEVADVAWSDRKALLDDVPGAVDRRFHLGRGRIPTASLPNGEVPEQSGQRPNRSDRPEILCQSGPVGSSPAFTVRRSGDRYLLVQAGPLELDLTVRVWIHLLADALRKLRIEGVAEIVEGVRSVLVCVGDSRLTLPSLAAQLAELATGLEDPATVVLDVREVELPIAFDHPEVHEAMRRYDSVRPQAPWSPDNVEFIQRVNDLDSRGEVFDTVAAASYLVVGLGDVYLGAPVAVPIDPRHRLVTTKYNPARMWTPQNAVGIGGIYLCVYGMEGPGGYQLVGRTVPVWRLAQGDEKPWLLRQFDRLRFTPVPVAQLQSLRAEIKSGRTDLVMRPATFSIQEVADLTRQHGAEIIRLRAKRRAAFDAERKRWSV